MVHKTGAAQFDDGYQDNYTFGFPIWKKYGIKATIFLISSRVDTPRHLNWREIGEMRGSGLVEVGAHTETHRDLTTLSPAAQVEEIAGSKESIEMHTGQKVIVFDYPAGRYNTASVSDVAGAGYRFAVTTNPGDATRDQNLLLLDRVRVDGNEPLVSFEATLAPVFVPRPSVPNMASRSLTSGTDY